MKKAVIFDLDGTLLNTLDDLADSMNFALKSAGLPTHPVESYKYFVGNGMVKLTERVLPPDKSNDKSVFAQVFDCFMNRYKDHSRDKTAPYEDIEKLLHSLRENGIKIAVVTNKAHDAAQKVVSHYFGDIFDIVIGQSEQVKVKPDPSGVKFVMSELSVNADECLFVGDSSVDMQTAKNAKTTAIGVLWGFRLKDELCENGADYIVLNPMEILKIAKEN